MSMSSPKLLTDDHAHGVLIAFATLGDVAEHEIDRILGSTYPLSDREIVITLRMSAALDVPVLFTLPPVYQLLWTAIEGGNIETTSIIADALCASDALKPDERESLLLSVLASFIPEQDEDARIAEMLSLFNELQALNPEAANALLAEMRADHQRSEAGAA